MSDSIHKKTGLLVEGGGMKCAYSAGILDRMLDENISFDFCIGISAGSANLSSFLAGQRGRNLRFYVEHIHEPDYFGTKSLFENGDLFNLKYIYATLSNSDGADPLDYEALMKNPTEFTIVSTNAVTGKPVYFTKADLKQDDYRAIMASSAIPAACRPVEFNGAFYYDGGVSDSLPVRYATETAGCEKLVVILARSKDYIKTPEQHRLIYSTMCRDYPAIIANLNRRHIPYMKSRRQILEMEKENTAFIFAPGEQLHTSTYHMDEKDNQKLYDLGVEDFNRSLDRLRDFLKDQ